MKRIVLFVALCLGALPYMMADTFPDRYPTVDDAMASFVNPEGEEEQIENGGTYDAPLVVTFTANPIDTIGYDVLYGWTIEQIKGAVTTTLAIRPEERTTYTFTEGGADVSYRITLAISYRHRDTGIEGEGEAEPITFSLHGSSLQLYNAFSPNGDGTNDVYRVKTLSLLAFRMKIFNRWGQEIVSGNQDTLPIEYTNANGEIDGFTYYVCWDGTYHGHTVEDGVYFILVEAEGADGIKYVRRGDINILTKSRKEAKQ